MSEVKNLMVDAGGAKIPCAVFGKGEKCVVILPGVGDGLTTVEGKAAFLAPTYKDARKKYKIIMMSRRIPLPDKFTTKDMAGDIKLVMDALGIEKASIFGVSMGGMIAQYFAADYPERTEKLVLAVTAAKKTEEMENSGKEWLEYIEKGDGVGFMKSSVKNMYTEKYYKKNGWLCGLTGRFMMPKSYERYLRMWDACVSHNAVDSLCKITAPTLIIGGKEDRTVGTKASYELKEKIRGAELFMYEGFGHALYDEAPDFYKKVFDFIGDD